MENYFLFTVDLLPFWRRIVPERPYIAEEELPCENKEYVQIVDMLSNYTIALLSLTVGWVVIQSLWRRFGKNRESPTVDKEQLFRTLCVDAHVAQLWKLKTKRARSKSADSRSVKKWPNSKDKKVLARMAELEKRLLTVDHEKEGLAGLLLAAEEKYMARDRNAQEYWFALQMVGKQIHAIKNEASTLRSRLHAFETQSPFSIQQWAISAAMHNHLHQPKQTNTADVPPVRKCQSSPTAAVKQVDSNVQSIVRCDVDGGVSGGDMLHPVTSDVTTAEQFVNSRQSESTYDRDSLATGDQLRMCMEGTTPLLAGTNELPPKSGDNATEGHAHCHLPLRADLPVDHEVATLPDSFQISPWRQPVSDAVSSYILPTDVHDACVHDKCPEPRFASSSSPPRAYMYPIMALLGSEAGDTVNSSTPPSLSGREICSSCCSDNGKTGEQPIEERERRRNQPSRRSRIPLPQDFPRKESYESVD